MLVSAVRLTAFSVVIDTKLSGVQGCLLLSLLLSQQQKRPGCWRNGLTSSSLPTPLFLVTFSPMMLHSKRSVNQWRSLSFKGKRKYTRSLHHCQHLCHLDLLIYTERIALPRPRNLKSSCLLVCEWHPLLLCLLQVSPALPSEEGSPQRPSPPGHHENTVSKNRGLLLSFQLFRSSRYLSLPLALLDGGHARRSSTRRHEMILHPAEERCWCFFFFVKYCREIA